MIVSHSIKKCDMCTANSELDRSFNLQSIGDDDGNDSDDFISNPLNFYGHA